MFLLKKIISRLFFPLLLVIALLTAGLLWPKKGKKLILAAVILLYLFSFDPFACLLLWPLERRYSPVSGVSIRKEIKWIVVLGGGSRENPSLTPEDRLNDSSLKRLMEGLRLCRNLPEARLVLSGGDYYGKTSDAKLMWEVALPLDRSPSRMILEKSSWDTHDEARLLKDQLGQTPFYLVTSAGHMPRSMAMFKKLKTSPIAAPTDFQAVWESFHLTMFFPQANALKKTEQAFYEYLGLMWGWINGYV